MASKGANTVTLRMLKNFSPTDEERKDSSRLRQDALKVIDRLNGGGSAEHRKARGEYALEGRQGSGVKLTVSATKKEALVLQVRLMQLVRRRERGSAQQDPQCSTGGKAKVAPSSAAASSPAAATAAATAAGAGSVPRSGRKAEAKRATTPARVPVEGAAKVRKLAKSKAATRSRAKAAAVARSKAPAAALKRALVILEGDHPNNEMVTDLLIKAKGQPRVRVVRKLVAELFSKKHKGVKSKEMAERIADERRRQSQRQEAAQRRPERQSRPRRAPQLVFQPLPPVPVPAGGFVREVPGPVAMAPSLGNEFLPPAGPRGLGYLVGHKRPQNRAYLPRKRARLA